MNLSPSDRKRLQHLHWGVSLARRDIDSQESSLEQYRRLERAGLVETEYSCLGGPPVCTVTEEGLQALGYDEEEIEEILQEQGR